MTIISKKRFIWFSFVYIGLYQLVSCIASIYYLGIGLIRNRFVLVFVFFRFVRFFNFLLAKLISNLFYEPTPISFLILDSLLTLKYYQIMTDNKLFEAVDIPCQHKDLIHDVAYDYFGHRLATASSDQTVKIWDYDQETKKWICTASWKCHFGSVWKVTWVSLSRCFSRKKRFNYTHSDT